MRSSWTVAQGSRWWGSFCARTWPSGMGPHPGLRATCGLTSTAVVWCQSAMEPRTIHARRR